MTRRETRIFFLEKLHQAEDPGRLVLFLQALVMSALSIGAGFLLFPAEASLIGVFLVAIAQSGTAHLLLERNRDEIWTQRKDAGRANLRLATSLLTIFVGVVLTYAAATLLVPQDALLTLFDRQIGDFGGHSLTEVVFDDLGGVLGTNALVLVLCLLVAVFYRHGGMLLVLGWNASVWGVVFAYVARTAPDAGAGGTALYFGKSFFAIFPHLALEATAYVLAAMAGVFFSKAVQKYGLGSRDFVQVMGAVGRVGAAALAMLVLAALCEAWLAPAFIRALF